MPASKTMRICEKGHTYFKSSDCPVCPACDQERKPQESFMSRLSAPARRALEHQGITTPEQLAACTQKEILKLHGMGPASLPLLTRALEECGLMFKK